MKKINNSIIEVLKTLEDKGYEAYVVGGATRDFLLNKEITDIDINTNASSNTIKQLFNNYPLYDIGKNLGTVTVLINKQKIDITPFRTEGKYTNHRRPTSVSFSSTLYDDLKRRDFTINALCVDSHMKIIDYFDGLIDLKNKTIKAIGNPHKRFDEDALRILRGIRFSAQLNFTIDQNTKEFIHKDKKLLNSISNERKKDEFLKTLSFSNSYKILKEFNDVFEIFFSIKHLNKKIDLFDNPYYKIAYLIDESDLDKLKKLTFSKHEINLIRDLIIAKKVKLNNDYSLIKCLSYSLSLNETINFIEELHQIKLDKKIRTIKKYSVDQNSLKITGQELMKLGYNGPKIKMIKDELVDQIHKQNLSNTKTSIKAYLKSK